MLFEKKNNFCFIDVGSYKTICLICNISEDSISYLSSSIVKTRGIKNGRIYDAREVKSSILAAVYEAEKSGSVNVDEVVASVSSNECQSKRVVVRDYLFGRQVTAEDTRRLVNKSLSEIDSSKFEVIHCFPKRFCLDDLTIVKNPENLFADSVEAEICMFYSNISYLVNLATILAGCHLKPLDFVLDIYAASITVLPESANKSLVIDIGGDLTKYAYFEDGVLNKCGYIPLGGNQVTKDIASFFSTSYEEAERLKTVHGDLLSFSDDKLVSIKQFSDLTNLEPNSIKRSDLNQVIASRLEELVEILHKKTQGIAYSRVYLTGGGTKLPGISGIFEKMIRKPVEIGNIKFKIGNPNIEKDLGYATVVGLAKCFFISRRQTKLTVSTSPFVKIFNWLKTNF